MRSIKSQKHNQVRIELKDYYDCWYGDDFDDFDDYWWMYIQYDYKTQPYQSTGRYKLYKRGSGYRKLEEEHSTLSEIDMESIYSIERKREKRINVILGIDIDTLKVPTISDIWTNQI